MQLQVAESTKDKTYEAPILVEPNNLPNNRRYNTPNTQASTKEGMLMTGLDILLPYMWDFDDISQLY